MCLGIPGEVLEIGDDPLRTARVDFGGIVRPVALVYTPEAEVGDHVIVHVGFAISRIDPERAREVWRTLERLGELDELQLPDEPGGGQRT